MFKVNPKPWRWKPFVFGVQAFFLGCFAGMLATAVVAIAEAAYLVLGG